MARGKLLVDWIVENPEYSYLLDEWDTEKNRSELGLEIEDVTKGSELKLWWFCRECGESFQRTLCTMLRGIDSNKTKVVGLCRNCGIKYVIKDREENKIKKNGNLKEWIKQNQEFEYLIDEWDAEKNREELGLEIEDVSYGSNKKVWWICRECGKCFQRAISGRTRAIDSGCRKCGKQVAKMKYSENKLKTNGSFREWCEKNNRLDLLEEFDYEKNMNEFKITPDNVTAKKNGKIYWKCKLGHKYKMSLNTKVGKNCGCPICQKAHKSSFSEQAIYYYLKDDIPDIINSYKTDWLNHSEIDIFIPSLNLGIEYDGQRWHQNAERDYSKNNLLKEHNVNLIRIREERCPILLDKNCKYIYTDKPTTNNKHMNKTLNEIFKYLKDEYGLYICSDINVIRDYIEIRNQLTYIVNSKTLSIVNPELAKEWHPTKNKGLTPDIINATANFKVWWLCPECGNEYQAAIHHRNMGSGCKKCWLKRQKSDLNLDWIEKYRAVKDYYSTANSKNILQDIRLTTKAGNTFDLYSWIKRQRLLNKSGDLAIEKVQLLDSLGILWNISEEDKWMEKYCRLKEYYVECGSLNVESLLRLHTTSGLDFSPYDFMRAQRVLYSEGKLESYKISLLNELNMVWDINCGNNIDLDWMAKFNTIKKYYNEYNTLIFDKDVVLVTEYGIEFNAWRWIAKQRLDFEKQKMSQYRIDALNSINMEWYDKNKLANVWIEKFEAIKKFREKDKIKKSTNLRTISGLNFKPYEWIIRQKEKYSKGLLTDEQKTLLEQIDVISLNSNSTQLENPTNSEESNNKKEIPKIKYVSKKRS